MKSWLEKNDIEMYSTHNEEKPAVAAECIRILRNETYEYMNSISKNMYINQLDIVNKYNNTYQNTIKMKLFDVKSSTYIDFDKKNSKEDPKFIVGDHVRISEYKNIFAKGYVPNWSQEVFVIIKVRDTVPWTYPISNLRGEEMIGTSHIKGLQKRTKKSLELKK